MQRRFRQQFMCLLMKTCGWGLRKWSKTKTAVRLATLLAGLCPVYVPAVEPQEQAGPRVPVTCNLIENASIVIHDVDEAPYGHANVGHQIGAGSRTVLTFRAWEDSGSSDTAQLWKVTLEFAPVNAAMPLGKVIDVPVLRSYFTYGGYVWLRSDGYVWGKNVVHRIGLVRTHAGLAARLHGPLMGKAAMNGAPTRTAVAWRCHVMQRNVATLDPWEGKPGTTPQSFHPANPPRPVDHL